MTRSKKPPLYTLHERIWHWLQGLAIVLLIASGLHLHYPTSCGLCGDLAQAVKLHEFLGFLLVLNAALGLFYTLTTDRIRGYIPMPMDFTRGIFEQARYYLGGIFRGEPHPFEKSAGRRLNPLQKITYFFLLTVLLPLQMATGVALWSVTEWPEVFERLGGMRVLGPIHTLLAFFFLAFLIIHLYLATTGPTPGALYREMVTGREEPGPRDDS